MGHRKFRLSKLPKNSERNCKGQRSVGRPCKQVPRQLDTDATSSAVLTTPEPSSKPSPSPAVCMNDTASSQCNLLLYL